MSFQKKTQHLDWSLVLSLNVDALQQVKYIYSYYHEYLNI